MSYTICFLYFRCATEYIYDVIVGGGSVSGLLAAREISSNGFKVLVLKRISQDRDSRALWWCRLQKDQKSRNNFKN